MAENVFTPLVAVYVKQVLNGERTLESVPEILRDQVAEQISTDNIDALVQVYATNILTGKLFIGEIKNPELLEKVNIVIEDINDVNVNLYVANIIEGKITIDDVPYKLRERVRVEVESNIGKKI